MLDLDFSPNLVSIAPDLASRGSSMVHGQRRTHFGAISAWCSLERRRFVSAKHILSAYMRAVVFCFRFGSFAAFSLDCS